MDLRRLRAGEWIVALSGVALLGSLFAPWYAAGRTGWEALAANDVILALIAGAAVALWLITASQSVPALPIAFAALVTLAGAVATILVAVRVIWPAGGAGSRDWGIWLALAGALGIAAGGWIGMRDERLSKPSRPTDSTGRPAPPPPEVETLPAPRS